MVALTWPLTAPVPQDMRWLAVEDASAIGACRNAVLNMMELLQERGFSREQAYVICSVAVDLRISNVVDVPNYVVSALLPEAMKRLALRATAAPAQSLRIAGLTAACAGVALVWLLRR